MCVWVLRESRDAGTKVQVVFSLYDSHGLVNGFKWAPTFVCDSLHLFRRYRACFHRLDPCNLTPLLLGFMSLCRLVLYHVRVTCSDWVPASKTVKHLTVSKEYLWLMRPPLTLSYSEHIDAAFPWPHARKSDSFKHRSANLLFYGPYYMLGKFAKENFSIILHFGVDCTRPVEQTSSVAPWLFLPNQSVAFICLAWPQSVGHCVWAPSKDWCSFAYKTHCPQLFIHSFDVSKEAANERCHRYVLTFVNTLSLN